MPSNHDPFVEHDPKRFLARERKGIDKDTGAAVPLHDLCDFILNLREKTMRQ